VEAGNQGRMGGIGDVDTGDKWTSEIITNKPDFCSGLF